VRIVVHADAARFLDRAGPWLERAEDANNLVLSVARSIADGPPPAEGDEAPFFATVEEGAEVVGCSFRTPPHKLVLTAMPAEGARLVAEAAAERWATVPATLGPAAEAHAAAEAFAALRGGRTADGMKQRIHRLDAVVAPRDVPGRMRPAVEAELPLVAEWGEGFAADAGIEFRTAPGTRAAWVRAGRLFFWEDGAPVAMAVATGATRRGVRVGYVYTPPERRRRGYGTALVAELSARLLDEGFAFCVLYTDLANRTSNAIYARVGYRPVLDVEDVWIGRA
jgi:GNAT superfamily N-acetyltransferase